MNMRGKAQLELFGPDTLEQINEKIRGYADTLGVDVEIFHSNIVGEVINALYDAHGLDFDGAPDQPRRVHHQYRAPSKRHFPGALPRHRGPRHQPHCPGHHLSSTAGLQRLHIWLWNLRLLYWPGSDQTSGRVIEQGPSNEAWPATLSGRIASRRSRRLSSASPLRPAAPGKLRSTCGSRARHHRHEDSLTPT